jgi:hypothetical protein
MPKRINQQLVNFLAPKLRHELGFRVPIFFHVFLIIRFFRFPDGFIPSNRRQYKGVKQTALKRLLRQHLYEAGCSSHYQMHKWWNDSQPLHRHQFLEAMFNCGYFKPSLFKLLYSMAHHGFSNSRFHELCDNKGPTMTVYSLNGKTVVAILQQSWNILNPGWNYDQDLKIFFVDHDGTTTELECTCEKEKQKYLNGSLCGPHVGGLPLDLTSQRTEVHFLKRELITGSPQICDASIDSVVVLQMSICLESVSPLILARVARVVAPYLRIGREGEAHFPYYPPCFCSPTIATLWQNY